MSAAKFTLTFELSHPPTIGEIGIIRDAALDTLSNRVQREGLTQKGSAFALRITRIEITPKKKGLTSASVSFA